MKETDDVSYPIRSERIALNTMPTLQMPELNFRNVRLIVYTVFTWISLVAGAAAQNSLHKLSLAFFSPPFLASSKENRAD